MGFTHRLEAIVRRLERRVASRRVRAPIDERPDPGRPVGSDALPVIHHVVVLMMENHSFDNYLGVLGRGDGLPLGPDGKPAVTNTGRDGRVVGAHRLGATTQLVGQPTQLWAASHEQWADGSNSGFLRVAEARADILGGDADPAVTMGYWTDEDLPFYAALARTFPLADRWFASCLGPTFPNRRFLLAATAHGLTSDRLAQVFDRPEHGTVFDLLTAYGISWANYHPVPHRRPLARRLLSAHGLRLARWSTAMLHRLARASKSAPALPKSLLEFTGDVYPLGMVRYLLHVRSIERFHADAAAGDLPAVSIVDPDFRTCSEENPQDIHDGEAFTASIINAVLTGPAWPHTVLVWVYDEHGGYFDHVAPPAAIRPDDWPPRDGGTWSYDRLGFRVPAVIVSPYGRPDYVSHIERDHTSLLKLIETKWNLPPLTRRDAAADDLLDCLDLSGPPAFLVPPPLPEPAKHAAARP